MYEPTFMKDNLIGYLKQINFMYVKYTSIKLRKQARKEERGREGEREGWREGEREGWRT